MNPLLLLLLIGGGAYALSNLNKAKITEATAQINLVGIKINTKNILAPYFELTFNIFNTVDSNLKLQGISGSVIYKGAPVAALQYASQVTIKKGDNFIIVKAVPDSFVIIQQLISLIGGTFSKDISVQGTAIINGIQVPIQKQLV
jgi:hypothetical protein